MQLHPDPNPHPSPFPSQVIIFNKGEGVMQLHEKKGKHGAPVTCGDWLFDNRLGHRGMGNKADEPRPTLYLTYTNKPGWTDKDNFSRARFKKLGERVGAKPSRAERAVARRG